MLSPRPPSPVGIPASSAAPSNASPTHPDTIGQGGWITTRDGARIHYKDWGRGPVVVFSHGWPLTADSWEPQMAFLAARGYRCIAHDRRGHGRSSQPFDGNDMDSYADDLAELIEALDLHEVALFGFSTGGGEVARYVGRHGTGRIAKLGLISAVPPRMVRDDANPEGVPREVFDGLREGSLTNRSQLYRDLAAGPFFGFDRPGAVVSEGLVDWFWMQGMLCGLRNTYECIAAFSETDFHADLERFDVPTLVLHGDDDQVVPFPISGPRSARIVKGSRLLVYEGAPHGLTSTHVHRVNADLLTFLET